MSDRIRITRDIRCIIEGKRCTFKKGAGLSASLAPWLPTDAYEEYVRPPTDPFPNEIVIDYKPEPVEPSVAEVELPADDAPDSPSEDVSDEAY